MIAANHSSTGNASRSWLVAAIIAGWLLPTHGAILAAEGDPAAKSNPAPQRAHWSVVSAGQADTLQQIIWTGREFLAVGGDAVLNSPDGLKWTAHHLGIKDKLLGVAYNSSLYVVVGENGVIFTSPDLTTWIVCPPQGSQRLNSVFSGSGGDFFAMGDHTILMTQNGRDWITTASLLSGPTTGPAIPNANLRHGANLAIGKYVLADGNGGLWTSAGIINWNKTLTTTGGMADVAANGTVLVAVGEPPNNVYASLDGGVNWAPQTSGVAVNLNGVAAGGGQFVAVGDNGTALTSTNATQWTAEPTDTTINFTSVASNGKIFVAVTGKGAVLARDLPAPSYTTASLAMLSQPKTAAPAPSGSSGPLDNWTVVSAGVATQIWRLAWVGNSFVCLSSNGRILTSPDGVTWTRQTSKTSSHLFDIATDGKIFVVPGDNDTILTSPDLKDWTVRKAGTGQRNFSVIWTGTQFVVLSADKSAVSPDGVTWRMQYNSSDRGFHHGVWTGSQLIIASHYGIVRSPDGASWSSTLSTSSSMLDVKSDGSLYVAVGEQVGLLYISLDGQTWTPRPSGVNEGLSAITWTGSQFVSAGMNDTLVSSSDGMSWAVNHTGTGLRLNAIAAHGDTIVAGSYSGEILINKKVAVTAPPEIMLAPGAPGSVPQVLLACPTAGAKIYYSTDGTEPSADSLLYAAPFSPAGPVTIRARAIKDGMPASEMAVAQFTPGP